MERAAIVEGVQKCIRSQLSGPIPGLEDNLNKDLGADSLDRVEIVIMIEDDFGIDIPDEEFEKVRTVEDLVNIIEKKTQK